MNKLSELSPIITIQGITNIYIQNFEQIISISTTQIEIKTAKYFVKIEGMDLYMEFMDDEEAKAVGMIDHVHFKMRS